MKRTAAGYASNWICDNLRAGSTIRVLTPTVIFAAELSRLAAEHPGRLRVLHWLESERGLPHRPAPQDLCREWVKSAGQCSLGRLAWKDRKEDLGLFFGAG
jgi:3-ketosteroid 9alpha-monooxygenase subunit B